MERFKENKTYQVDDECFVMFTCECASGYVGETLHWFSAYLINVNTKNMSTEEIGYEKIKELYKNVDGKRDRISYWFWMKEFSEKGIAERSQIEYEDVMSRIK